MSEFRSPIFIHIAEVRAAVASFERSSRDLSHGASAMCRETFSFCGRETACEIRSLTGAFSGNLCSFIARVAQLVSSQSKAGFTLSLTVDFLHTWTSVSLDTIANKHTCRTNGFWEGTQEWFGGCENAFRRPMVSDILFVVSEKNSPVRGMYVCYVDYWYVVTIWTNSEGESTP